MGFLCVERKGKREGEEGRGREEGMKSRNYASEFAGHHEGKRSTLTLQRLASGYTGDSYSSISASVILSYESKDKKT